MKNTLKFALTAVLLSIASVASANVADSVKLSKAVKTAVTADSSKVLEIVAANIAANESCACEIVKAAIVASDADKKLVAEIVNTAILAAPSQIRVITQCAMATAPDAVVAVPKVSSALQSSDGLALPLGLGKTPRNRRVPGYDSRVPDASGNDDDLDKYHLPSKGEDEASRSRSRRNGLLNDFDALDC